MKLKINYHYTIPFKDVNHFKFQYYGVDETEYEELLIPPLNKIISILQENSKSRQAVLVPHKQFNNYSCLLSIQYQIIEEELIVIANFRSQCSINGRPSDSLMIQYISNIIRKELGLNKYKIYVNVGNYHYNPELTKIRNEREDIQRNIKEMKLKYKG